MGWFETMPSLRLIVLPISPWSERARWVLDHHKLAYKVSEHVPFLGERRLRRLVGPDKPKATVPVLLVDGAVISESLEIARYADRIGAGTPLLPPELEAEILRYSALADATMAEGRALVTAGMLASPGALDEALPPAFPRWLRPILRPITRYSTAWFARKYGLSLDQLDARRAKIRAALPALREGLAGGGEYLLGKFSYADIVMATALQGISPVADRYVPLGPATRAVWTQAEIAQDFADLVAWRDAVYAARR